MNRDTAVIIPVYNEGRVIKGVLKSVLKDFAFVICVDDGSSDNSASEVQSTSALFVRHPFNIGQGAALQTGIEFAKENADIKYFVTFDADGQHRIKDVHTMLSKLRTGKYDIVLGSRFLGVTSNVKRSKRAVLKLAIKFSNLMSGLDLSDAHNGLRAFNRHVADTVNITMPDYAHASEILETIAEKKYRYTEVPVAIEYSKYSLSKGQNTINAINIGFDVVLRRLTK